MPPIHAMIKPASSQCNMKCTYCFYRDESERRAVSSFGVMEQSTLALIIQKVLVSAEGRCTFSFQGGEPTLAGLKFFQQVVQLQRKFNVKQLEIHNALQTNGYTLDDNWCAFLAENHFLVGVSLDGYESIHNSYRRTVSGRDTFATILQNIHRLEQYGVDFNILTVLSPQIARNIKKVFHYYLENGLVYQQYIPLITPFSSEDAPPPYRLTPLLYASAMKNLFDAWYRATVRGQRVFIRYFSNLLDRIAGRQPESCDLAGTCSYQQFVFEADGSAYPCDFYVLDDYRLGNIREDSIPSLNRRKTQMAFVEKSQILPQACRRCEWFSLCRGGCQRYRESSSGDAPRHIYCQSYREIFPYIVPRMMQLVQSSYDLL